MLVLSRKEGERIVIGDNITLIVSKVNGNRVTIGIEAPRDLKVVRGELNEINSKEVDRIASPSISSTSTSGLLTSCNEIKKNRSTLREFAATVLPTLQRQVG